MRAKGGARTPSHCSHVSFIPIALDWARVSVEVVVVVVVVVDAP